MSKARRRSGRFAVWTLWLAAALFMLAGCGGAEDDDEADYEAAEPSAAAVSVVRAELSEAGLAGEALFNANCTRCHGRNAAGSGQGPPLVDQIYEPGHHANASFVIAVTRGVRQHHWEFGNMPAVPELSIDEVQQVICYVREMQLANEIIERIPSTTRC